MTPDADGDVAKKVGAKMDAMYPRGRGFQRREVSSENVRRARFGFVMVLLGIIAMIGGIFPFPLDILGRAVFLVGGLVYTTVGVWQIHRANRDLLERRDESDSR